MKHKISCLFLLLCIVVSAGNARSTDSLFRRQILTPAPQVGLATMNGELDSYLQYGFHLGTDLMLSGRQLSSFDNLENLLSGIFGFFVRGGYQYIFGELGFHYMFFKGYYNVSTLDGIPLGAETVESRYLQIPFKIVGYIPVGKRNMCAFLPHVGISYQPLIHVTTNDINYGKHNLTPHQFLYQAGLGFRVKFFNVEVAWKKSIKPFYCDRTSLKPSYLNILVGFQF